MSSTLQPAVRSSGLASSISLWLMPPTHGTKTMALGATVDGVVPGAADDVLVRVALRRGGVAHRGYQIRVERGRRDIPELLDLGLLANPRSRRLAGLPQVTVHLCKYRVLGLSLIHI